MSYVKRAFALSRRNASLFLCLLVLSDASIALESESLEAFKATCDFRQPELPVVSANFAPIRPRNVDDTNGDGSWGYVFENNERRYSNDEYAIPGDGGQIHFVSTLEARGHLINIFWPGS